MTRTYSRLAAALICGAVALVGSVPALAQAQGSTTISVQIPDIVILHYFSTVNVAIDANALGSFLTGVPGDSGVDEGGTAGPATSSGSGFTLDLAMTPSALTGDPSAALLVLENAWAVRAISIGAVGSQTQLAVAVTTPTMSNGAASMDISGATVNDGSSNAATIAFASPGLITPQVGDVELTLDMSLANAAGTYAGGVFTLTATNI